MIGRGDFNATFFESSVETVKDSRMVHLDLLVIHLCLF